MTAENALSFWNECRKHLPSLPEALPEAWAFGATGQHADELLALVLQGVKTGTASSLWDYESSSDPIPHEGELSLILDSAGTPRVLIRTTRVEVLPFDEVGAEHAHSEGEGDRTLAYWRQSHRQYWENHSENPRGFQPQMPIVCERFEVVWAPTQK